MGLLLLTIVALSIVQVNSPSYKFLADRLHSDNMVRKYVKRRTSYGWFYSFPADFNNICSEATIELLKLGFKERHPSERSTVHRVFELGDEDDCTIQIVKGIRLTKESTPPSMMPMSYDPNWINVRVEYYPNKVSIWHRFKARCRILL